MKLLKCIATSLCLALYFCALSSRADDPVYSSDLGEWTEVVIPPSQAPRADRVVWFYAANHSSYEWTVDSDEGKISVVRSDRRKKSAEKQPSFVPKAGKFVGAFAASRVDDGWLVGFNRGEFGAALYWFNENGTDSYWISNHKVVEFISRSDRIYAIEGLAHLGLSSGSLIQIVRPQGGRRWECVPVVNLPFAPYAVSVNTEGIFFITLSDGLVAVGVDGKVETLLSDPPWAGLYPNSSVLSKDQKRLYIGMRQFVCEFDLESKTLRFLIPSEAFRNKLPTEDEARMRKQYGR